MTPTPLTFTIDPDELVGAISRPLWAIQSDVQLAMAVAYERIVLDNFGSAGIDRPWDWMELTPKWAKILGRSYATLEVTGNMKRAVTVRNGPDEASVSLSNADVPYAMAHHTGNPPNFGTRANDGQLAARRVFPIQEDGNPTDFAIATVTAAAEDALRKAIR